MESAAVILAAVDGSDQSMNTVAYLSRMLSPKNVAIELFHVSAEAPESFFDLGEIKETAGYEQEIEKWKNNRSGRIDRFMDEARTLFMHAGFPSGSISVTIQPRREGIARDIILKSDLGYAAVVIGRKGYGRLPDYVLGSIAAKLADTIADVPLVIVGGQPETRKVVVAFDRSRGIRKGLDRVSPLFSRKLEEILLCHIVRPLSEPHSARTHYFCKRNEAYWLDENSRKIVPAMVDAKQHLSSAGFAPYSLRTAIIKERTSRADGLCSEANTLGADTIVVGRRGVTTVEAFNMGRVTRKILFLAFNRAIWIV
jgi:nucleotide-binding universal stress UspA family protein